MLDGSIWEIRVWPFQATFSEVTHLCICKNQRHYCWVMCFWEHRLFGTRLAQVSTPVLLLSDWPWTGSSLLVHWFPHIWNGNDGAISTNNTVCWWGWVNQYGEHLDIWYVLNQCLRWLLSLMILQFFELQNYEVEDFTYHWMSRREGLRNL